MNNQRLAEILEDGHECGNILLSSDEEKALTAVVHWARNKRLGYKSSISHGWRPGPHGFKDKKGWWWPFPPEGCDFPISHVSDLEKPGNKLKFDPWARWKHCMSLDHCKYLVKHRRAYIWDTLIEVPDLNVFVKALLRNRVPLLMKTSYWELNEFVSDYFKGKILDWKTL